MSINQWTVDTKPMTANGPENRVTELRENLTERRDHATRQIEQLEADMVEWCAIRDACAAGLEVCSPDLAGLPH